MEALIELAQPRRIDSSLERSATSGVWVAPRILYSGGSSIVSTSMPRKPSAPLSLEAKPEFEASWMIMLITETRLVALHEPVGPDRQASPEVCAGIVLRTVNRPPTQPSWSSVGMEEPES